MDRVRLLSSVFFWLGWVALAFSILTAIVTTSASLASQQFGYERFGPGTFMPQPIVATIASLPFHFVLPVVLFFGWGVLTSLFEIHERIAEQTDLLLEEDDEPDTADS